MTKCIICNQENAPYKCPNCRVSYCSVTCSKNHKNVGCIKPNPKPLEENNDYKYVTEDTVAVEKLQLLEHDEALHLILKNPHLRNILLEIDGSKNPEEIMDRAMKEPIFVEYADACLRVVEGVKKEDC